MYYFADGDQGLIRVDSSDEVNSSEFYDSPAQTYHGAPLGWVESPAGNNLPSQATNSGDYQQCDEQEAQQVMAALDARRATMNAARSR